MPYNKDNGKVIERLQTAIHSKKGEIKNYSKQLAKELISEALFLEMTQEASVDVFCKNFFLKVASNFSIVLQLHFPQCCKLYFPVKYKNCRHLLPELIKGQYIQNS